MIWKGSFSSFLGRRQGDLRDRVLLNDFENIQSFTEHELGNGAYTFGYYFVD